MLVLFDHTERYKDGLCSGFRDVLWKTVIFAIFQKKKSKKSRKKQQSYSPVFHRKVRKIDQKQSGIGKGAVMKKKYVLFDFDGVIADTEESNSHYLGLALKEFGVELTEKDKQRLIGTHDQELLIEFLSRAPRKVTVEQLTRRRKELGNTYENGNIAPIPGIVPLIQGLRQSGVKTALVSSTATRLIIMD